MRQHTDAWYWYRISVRSSVRHFPVLDENGLTYCHSFITIQANRKLHSTWLKLLNGTSFSDLEWPQSQISRSRYYSTSNNWKWYKIELYLQWLTNRKSHMVYRTAPFSTTLTHNPRIRVRVRKVRKPYPNFQMVPLSMILSDLWPTFQGHDNIQCPITRLTVVVYDLSNGSVSSDLEWPLT